MRTNDHQPSRSLAGTKSVVVGGSRGIGAAVAVLLGARGSDVMLTFHAHRARAEQMAARITASQSRARVVQTDATSPQSRQELADTVAEDFGEADFLILSASGGLETGRAQDYARTLNTHGPVETARSCFRILKPGGVVVFLTSNEAHFYGQRMPFLPYQAIAESKHAGERALLAIRPEFEARGLRLNVVSSELVIDSYTAKILERRSPGLLDRFREQPDRLSTSESVAQLVVRCCEAPHAFGTVLFDPSMDRHQALRGGALATL